MGQKTFKKIRKYSKKTGVDYDGAKREFKKLDPKSKVRLLRAMSSLN
jgi:hypothetical protein